MSLENKIEKLEKEIEKLKVRNKIVELDKAWEVSNMRKILIVFLTYLIMVVVFWILESKKPFYDAIVPTTGFFLSTLSLSFLKRIWIKYKK